MESNRLVHDQIGVEVDQRLAEFQSRVHHRLSLKIE
jgi:hypothetical protein